MTGGLLLSRDRGEAWTRVITTSVSRLAYASSSTIFAVTLDGLIRSEDGGENWASASRGIDLAPLYDYNWIGNVIKLHDRSYGLRAIDGLRSTGPAVSHAR